MHRSYPFNPWETSSPHSIPNILVNSLVLPALVCELKKILADHQLLAISGPSAWFLFCLSAIPFDWDCRPVGVVLTSCMETVGDGLSYSTGRRCFDTVDYDLCGIFGWRTVLMALPWGDFSRNQTLSRCTFDAAVWGQKFKPSPWAFCRDRFSWRFCSHF